MGAGRKTQTVDVDTKAFGLLSFEQRQRNLGPAQLKGCIFGACPGCDAWLAAAPLCSYAKSRVLLAGCNHDTFKECVDNNLFGLPRAHWVYVQHITAGCVRAMQWDSEWSAEH